MGVKIFFLLTNFAQCSSSRSLTPEKWDVRTWNVEQIFGLSHGWLVSNIVDVYIKCCSQNLCIKNSSSSSQCRSLHSFPISLFICHCFGYRLLLQTCDRDCFRAFACRHLKWLWFSVKNWNLRRRSVLGQVVYLDLLLGNMMICSYALFSLRDQLMIECLKG